MHRDLDTYVASTYKMTTRFLLHSKYVGLCSCIVSI